MTPKRFYKFLRTHFISLAHSICEGSTTFYAFLLTKVIFSDSVRRPATMKNYLLLFPPFFYCISCLLDMDFLRHFSEEGLIDPHWERWLWYGTGKT